MSDSDQPEVNQLKRLKERIFRHPVAAWSVVIFTVLAALISIVPQIRDVVGLFPSKASPPALHLGLKTHDPRFEGVGEMLNWGGGSQTLWVDDGALSTSDGADRFVPEAELDARLKRAANAGRPVWEIVPPQGADGLLMEVDVVYPVAATEKVIVREWGVRARSASAPDTGFFAHYRTGGADVGREGAIVRVTGPGDFPIRRWVEWDGESGSERARGPTVEYLEPGEVKGLQIHVTGSEVPASVDALPPDRAGLLLTVYARVWIDGREWEIESPQAIRSVLPADDSYDFWRVTDSDTVEDLRPRALVER